MEQVTGIEPALKAWEALILPLNYTCPHTSPAPAGAKRAPHNADIKAYNRRANILQAFFYPNVHIFLHPHPKKQSGNGRDKVRRALKSGKFLKPYSNGRDKVPCALKGGKFLKPYSNGRDKVPCALKGGKFKNNIAMGVIKCRAGSGFPTAVYKMEYIREEIRNHDGAFARPLPFKQRDRIPKISQYPRPAPPCRRRSRHRCAGL